MLMQLWGGGEGGGGGGRPVQLGRVISFGLCKLIACEMYSPDISKHNMMKSVTGFDDVCSGV